MELHVKYIKAATGLNFKEFCRIHLNESERSFRQRINAGKLTFFNIKQLEKYTGKNISELFKNYIDNSAPKKRTSPRKKQTTKQQEEIKEIYFEF